MKTMIMMVFLTACSSQVSAPQETNSDFTTLSGCPSDNKCYDDYHTCYDSSEGYSCSATYYFCQSRYANCGGNLFLGCLWKCDAQYERCEEKCTDKGKTNCDVECKNRSHPCASACDQYGT
jgi:hypothetical protein